MRRPASILSEGAGACPTPTPVRSTLIALAIAFAAIIGAASFAEAQTVQITTNVSVNSSWGPTGTVVGTVFWVKNTIAVNGGVTLNIQPGVVVKFSSGANLQVNGTLKCIGTAVSNV